MLPEHFRHNRDIYGSRPNDKPSPTASKFELRTPRDRVPCHRDAPHICASRKLLTVVQQTRVENRIHEEISQIVALDSAAVCKTAPLMRMDAFDEGGGGGTDVSIFAGADLERMSRTFS